MEMRIQHFLVFGLMASSIALSESQDNDYKGITDPFGDPANYEFAEDEKEDKDFFHLGRYLMLGFDFGAGIFTQGLGQSTDPGFFTGVRLVYFFDRHLGMEAAAHYASHLDILNPSTAAFANIDTQLVPITLSFRYYFETKDSPRAFAVANPYLVLGAGAYLRNQKVLAQQNLAFNSSDGFTSNFGLNGGPGVEFDIYRRHVYLGADVRFHLVFFEDESTGITTESGQAIVSPNDRAGDYVTSCLTLTYNF
jgi:outer membrane protein W